MNKLILSAAVVCVLSLLVQGQNSKVDVGLPTLHLIKDVTLSPSYGCWSLGELKKGYQNTALFLSDYSKQRNRPDLLFQGACGSEDEFRASMAGDDMSLIADLGANVPVEDVSASRAFNLQRIHSFSAYSKFAQVAKVELNHTYAVLLNGRDRRGLFVFTVAEYIPNNSVSLKYAVKSYQIMVGGQIIDSSDFHWDKMNNY